MTSIKKLNILLFAFLFIVYSYYWHRPNWNDLGRYDLIESIVNYGTVNIDAYHQNTGDKATYNGHYYSDKAPGPAFLGVPVYWVMQKLIDTCTGGQPTEGWMVRILWYLKLFVIRIAVIVLPSALFGVLLFRFLRIWTGDTGYALILVFGYTLGTLAFPYSTLFYGHQFAAVCWFTAFMLIYSLNESHSQAHPYFLLAGVLCGYAVLSEYPVILLALVLTSYVCWKHPEKKSVGLFLAGAIIPAVILLYYNNLTTGSAFRVGYFHVAGEGFRNQMSHGIAGVTYPKATALWGITFSPFRGLFFYNPFLLGSLAGFYFMYLKKEYRREFWFCLVSFVVFLWFNASYYMWWGGWSLGPRHLIPMLPCLMLPLVFLPVNARKVLYPLMVLSIVIMFIGTAVNPQIPDSSPFPLGYALQSLASGHVTPNVGFVLGMGLPFGIYLLGGCMILGMLVLYRLAEKMHA